MIDPNKCFRGFARREDFQKPTMTIRKIVAEWLHANGYTGLCGDECGCSLADLMPCDGVDDCTPGYLHSDGCTRPEKEVT